MNLARFKIEIEDWLRYSPFVRTWIARWTFWKAQRMPSTTPDQAAVAVDCLCTAARLAVGAKQVIPIEREIIKRVKQLPSSKFDWRLFEKSANNRHLEKGVVLKPCLSEREKGVIYLSFEYQWIRLLQNCDLRELAKRYDLVVAPVWACPYSPADFILPELFPERVFIHLSDPNDQAILSRISPKYVVAPLLCSSWVNPDLYHPIPYDKKDVDIFMLANFGKYKRHHRLFGALRQMPRDVRVLLIGQHNGNRTADTIRQEARSYGVEDRIEIRTGVPDEEVLSSFARSKISIILSKREGSCVAVVESLFAGTPVGLLADAEVGSRQFINSATGRFLDGSHLASSLMEFLADASKYQPRQWALEHAISCHGSSAILNKIVKETSLASGQEWTCDLAPFHWRPDPQLLHASDRHRMRPSYEDIQSRYGLELGHPQFR